MTSDRIATEDFVTAGTTLSALGLDPDLATLALPASTTISAFGASLVDDANAAASIATLGLDADIATFALPASTTISTFGATLVDDANAAASIATLGLDADLATFAVPASTTISAFGATIVDDANAAATIATLGLDADIATFALPASTTISAFGASLIDDAAASNARTTLGLGTSAVLDTGTGASQVVLGAAITAGGPTGSATVAPIVTYNAAGQLTTVGSATITPAVGSITGLGTGVGTFLATPSSANLASALTDETGTGACVFAGSPTLTGLLTAAAANFSGVVSGGTSTGTNLQLSANQSSNASFLGFQRGWIASDSPIVLYGQSPTFTDRGYFFTVEGSTTITLDNTVSAVNPSGLADAGDFLQYTPTIILKKNGGANGFLAGLNYGPAAKNDPAVSANFSASYALISHYSLTADTKTGLSVGTGREVWLNPTFSTVNSGTITAGTHDHIVMNLTLNAGVTISQRRGIVINAATGAGTVTTEIGIYNALSETLLGAFTQGSSGQLTIDASGVLATSGTITSSHATGVTGQLDTTTAGFGGGLNAQRSRSGGAINNGDTLGSLNFRGHDGSAYVVGALISAVATEATAFSSGKRGTQLLIRTVPNLSSTLTTAITIDNDQSVTFAGTINAAALNATGIVHFGASAQVVIGTAGNYTTSANLTTTGSGALTIAGNCGFHGTAAVGQSTTASAAPAGGTGATAGAYDTAANRNTMITLVNAMRTCLRDHGLMA